MADRRYALLKRGFDPTADVAISGAWTFAEWTVFSAGAQLDVYSEVRAPTPQEIYFGFYSPGLGEDHRYWDLSMTADGDSFRLSSWEDTPGTQHIAWDAHRASGLSPRIDVITYGNTPDNPNHNFRGWADFFDGINIRSGYFQQQTFAGEAAYTSFYQGNDSYPANQRWQALEQEDATHGRLLISNDAGSTIKNVLRWTRNLATVTTIELGNTTDYPQHNLYGYLSTNAGPNFGGLDLAGTNVGLYLADLGAVADEQWWAWESGGGAGDLALFAANSTFSIKRNAWRGIRGTGAVVAGIEYGNNTDYPTHSIYGVTSIVQTGASPLSVQRTGSSANVGIGLIHATATRYIGLDSSGEFRYGATADLSGAGYRIWHEDNTTTETESLAFYAGRDFNQYIKVFGDASGNLIKSRSATSNAKELLINATTDAVNTAPSAGTNGIRLYVRGVQGAGLNNSGQFYIGSNATSGPLLTVASAGNALRITSPSGYVEVGPQNSSYTHFFTDRAKFYMNKPLEVETSVSEYNSGSPLELGYKDLRFSTQDTNITLGLTHRDSFLYHTSATAHTYSIPTNATTAFPLGTVINVFNNGTGTVTITGSVTIVWAGVGTTGTRIINQYGWCTLVKFATDSWLIQGSGLV